MSGTYLEITYRNGKAFAAYLYLPRQAGDRVVRSESVNDRLVIDRPADDRPIGIEILDPKSATTEQLNELLRKLSQPEVSDREFAPLNQTQERQQHEPLH